MNLCFNPEWIDLCEGLHERDRRPELLEDVKQSMGGNLCERTATCRLRERIFRRYDLDFLEAFWSIDSKLREWYLKYKDTLDSHIFPQHQFPQLRLWVSSASVLSLYFEEIHAKDLDCVSDEVKSAKEDKCTS